MPAIAEVSLVAKFTLTAPTEPPMRFTESEALPAVLLTLRRVTGRSKKPAEASKEAGPEGSGHERSPLPRAATDEQLTDAAVFP